MLISVPTYRGRSREYDLGALGFPYLAIADIIINAAYGGWSYWRTKQQIEQAKRVSGVGIASDLDIEAITDQIMQQVDTKVSKSQLAEYVRQAISGSPMATQELAPSALLETRIMALEQQRQPTGIPTWGWIALGLGGFLVLKQFGVF